MRNLFIVILGSLILLFTSFLYAEPMPQKEWTFLIFINGNNNLDEMGEQNIISMEKVGSNEQVNVVVQWASLASNNTKRLLIHKSSDPTRVTSPIIEELGHVDMGDVKSLKEFIDWGIKNYPAKHYFINVWDHGGGWHYSKTLRKNAMSSNPNDISYDDTTKHFITTEQLAQAMRETATKIGHKIEIYGSDACFMAMAEVADEMSDAVSYYVGSQAEELGDGWPYDTFLARWESTPHATPDQIAKILVEEFGKYYEKKSEEGTFFPFTFSGYNLDYLPVFNDAVVKLGNSINKASTDDRLKIVKTSSASQRFGLRSDYIDLMDFAKKLSQEELINPAILRDVQNAINQFVIANVVVSKSGPYNAYGVSIWLPIPEDSFIFNVYSKRYNRLRFNVHTNWLNTLKVLFENSFAQKSFQKIINKDHNPDMVKVR